MAGIKVDTVSIKEAWSSLKWDDKTRFQTQADFVKYHWENVRTKHVPAIELPTRKVVKFNK